MTTRYRDADGDIWESRPGNRVTLVEVSDPEEAGVLGSPDYTNVPFAEADRYHGLDWIEDGA